VSPKAYIETTIVSYLTARPSRDLVRAAHQQLTREWWASRGDYTLFISQFVLDEAAAGDVDAANAATRERIEELCRAAGFEPPVICTPLELSKE
jgi:hypothetical protein